MYIIIAIVIIVWSWVWLVKEQQTIVPLHEEVKRCESMVNSTRAECRNKIGIAVSIADRAAKQNQTTIAAILGPTNISLANLRYVGDIYPDISYDLNSAIDVAERTYAGYSAALAELGRAIQQYNACVRIIPTCIAAWVFGFDPEPLIDEQNLNDSKILNI